MRRITLIGIAVALLFSGNAWADQPALKLSNLNFGKAEVGSTVTGTVVVKNRSGESVQFNGGALTALNETTGWFIDSVTGSGSCRELNDTQTPLLPGQTCEFQLSFRPALEGPHRAKFCLFAPSDYCSLVLGYVSGN